MSLLLEALKKAALEKQEKNQLTSGNTALQTEEFQPEDLQLEESLGEISPEFEEAKQSVEESLNKAEAFAQRLTLATQVTQNTTSDALLPDFDPIESEGGSESGGESESEPALSLDPTEFEILEVLTQNAKPDVCEQPIESELPSVANQQPEFTISEEELEESVVTEEEPKQENTLEPAIQLDNEPAPKQDDTAQNVDAGATHKKTLAAAEASEQATESVKQPIPTHQNEFDNFEGDSLDPRQEKVARILRLTEQAETQRRHRKWLLSAAVVCALTGSVAYYSVERYKEISTSVITPKLATDSAALNEFENEGNFVELEGTEPSQIQQQDLTFQESTVVESKDRESSARESTQPDATYQSTNTPSGMVTNGTGAVVNQDAGKISHSLFEDRAPKTLVTKAPTGSYQAHLARHHGIQIAAKPINTATQFSSEASPIVTEDSVAASTAKLPESNAPQQTLADAISTGYSAWQQGNWSKAEHAYNRALELAPTSRDALLGAAAVAQELGKEAKSLAYYQQRLEIAPKDDYALAGLLNLANVGVVNHRFESELNNLIAEYPNAAHLHFLKGSLYASKQQWYPSQQAFFNAWKLDGKNPDYAFNLAVSMDHLDLPSEAVIYYQAAQELAQNNRHNFDTNQVQQRIEQLSELRE